VKTRAALSLLALLGAAGATNCGASGAPAALRTRRSCAHPPLAASRCVAPHPHARARAGVAVKKTPAVNAAGKKLSAFKAKSKLTQVHVGRKAKTFNL